MGSDLWHRLRNHWDVAPWMIQKGKQNHGRKHENYDNITGGIL